MSKMIFLSLMIVDRKINYIELILRSKDKVIIKFKIIRHFILMLMSPNRKQSKIVFLTKIQIKKYLNHRRIKKKKMKNQTIGEVKIGINIREHHV